MSENKHTTLGQMRDLAQRQDARDDQQEEQLAQHEEELGGVVKYTEQALTDEQKAQARKNIGAGTSNVPDYEIGGYSNEITWDGEIGDRVHVENSFEISSGVINSSVYAKVSGVTPDRSVFESGYTVRSVESGNEKTYIYPDDSGNLDIAVASDEVYSIADGTVVVVRMDNAQLNGIVFPEAGIYFTHMLVTQNGTPLVDMINTYLSAEGLEIPSYRMQKEYLPDHTHKWSDIEDPVCGEVVEASDTLTWDGVVTGSEEVVTYGSGTFYLISDQIPSVNDLRNGYVVEGYVGTNQFSWDITADSEDFNVHDDGFMGAEFVFVIPTDDYVTNGVTFTKAGIYFVKTDEFRATSFTVNNYSGFTNTTVIPLPENLLPESVESVTIRSSTAGSTKKFKLTVDDSGAITATEVS